MIEATLIPYLKSALNLPVYAEEPEEKPEEYVLIRLLDYSKTNCIDSASIEAECVSSSMYKASQLCVRVRSAMLQANTLSSISGVRSTDGSQALDTGDKTYRYDINFTIYYYSE